MGLDAEALAEEATHRQPNLVFVFAGSMEGAVDDPPVRVDPLGIDAKVPRLSWILKSEAKNINFKRLSG
jgi:hypothetical protein